MNDDFFQKEPNPQGDNGSAAADSDAARPVYDRPQDNMPPQGYDNSQPQQNIYQQPQQTVYQQQGNQQPQQNIYQQPQQTVYQQQGNQQPQQTVYQQQNNQQPYGYGQPQYQQRYGQPVYAYPNAAPQKGDSVGFGVASLVLGILSIFLFACCVNYIMALLAIIFGIVQIVRSNKRGMAIAGLITSVVSILLSTLMWIGAFSDLGDFNQIYDEIFDEYYDRSYDDMPNYNFDNYF